MSTTSDPRTILAGLGYDSAEVDAILASIITARDTRTTPQVRRYIPLDRLTEATGLALVVFNLPTERAMDVADACITIWLQVTVTWEDISAYIRDAGPAIAVAGGSFGTALEGWAGKIEQAIASGGYLDPREVSLQIRREMVASMVD